MIAYALDDEALKLNEHLDERFVGLMLQSKPLDRQLMMLCFFSALKSADIAELLSLTEAAVNVKKSRFRNKIRALMSHQP
jgi:DNA-directed RNA polymerase specialized sigma24 family protein